MTKSPYISKDYVPEDELSTDGYPALMKSIEKWQNICYRGVFDGGTLDCALCQLYYSNYDDSCRSCPVMRATGEPGCTESPYYEWASYHNTRRIPFSTRVVFDEKSLELAEAELEFLTQLLFEDKQDEVRKRSAEMKASAKYNFEPTKE